MTILKKVYGTLSCGPDLGSQSITYSLRGGTRLHYDTHVSTDPLQISHTNNSTTQNVDQVGLYQQLFRLHLTHHIQFDHHIRVQHNLQKALRLPHQLLDRHIEFSQSTSLRSVHQVVHQHCYDGLWALQHDVRLIW